MHHKFQKSKGNSRVTAFFCVNLNKVNKQNLF
jgi:hypothetical protein